MSKLLEYSADVNICNNEGLTAVSAKNSMRVLKYFFENRIEGDSNAKCSASVSAGYFFV